LFDKKEIFCVFYVILLGRKPMKRMRLTEFLTFSHGVSLFRAPRKKIGAAEDGSSVPDGTFPRNWRQNVLTRY